MPPWWRRCVARLAAAGPWIVLALLSTRPEAASAYATVGRLVVLLLGAGATVVAYGLLLRVARLPEDLRVLR